MKYVFMFFLTLSTHLCAESGRWAPTNIPNYSIKTRPSIEPVDLYAGPHLFIDDYLIAESTNLTRKTYHPKRFLDGPVVGNEQHTEQPFLTVIYDKQTNKYRMWYNYYLQDEGYIAYAESDDGIQWNTPNLGIIGPDNRLFQIQGYSVSVIDEGVDFSPSSKRYKLAWWGGADTIRDNPGLRIAFSPDGLHWTPYEHNPVIPFYFSVDDPRYHLMCADIIDIFYDPLRKHYGLFLKTTAIAEDNYIPGFRSDHYYRRLVGMSTSQNLLQWKRPWRIILPESRDEGLLEFYACTKPLVRGNLMITFVRMLHDEKPVEPGGEFDGIGYTTLATSRDGISWQRHDDIFFDRNPIPDTWDRAMTWVSCVLPVGNENYVYYGGYKLGHKKGKHQWRQLGVAKIPRDRFVSRGAEGKTPGRFLTAPFYCPQNQSFRLVLNARAEQGLIRVRICDEQGEPLSGFDYTDMEPVKGDDLTLPVKWKDGSGKTTCSIQIDKPVFRIDFELTNAHLFAFEAIRDK